jgi:hypothetical protein
MPIPLQDETAGTTIAKPQRVTPQPRQTELLAIHHRNLCKAEVDCRSKEHGSESQRGRRGDESCFQLRVEMHEDVPCSQCFQGLSH